MKEEIKIIIETYGKWTNNEWSMHILKQDRFFRYFSPRQCEEFIRLATKLGNDMALKVKAGDKYSPEYLTKKYNLMVKLGREYDFLMPGVVNFAQYHLNTITLSQDYIERMEQLQPELELILGPFDVKMLMFYHELFHYFEEQDPQLENAGIRISIQPLPLLKRTISPESIGEIAAFAFAKTMAGIAFHPCLLEQIWIA